MRKIHCDRCEFECPEELIKPHTWTSVEIKAHGPQHQRTNRHKIISIRYDICPECWKETLCFVDTRQETKPTRETLVKKLIKFFSGFTIISPKERPND